MTRFTDGLRTSLTDEWATPRELFDELDAEFHFDLDVASTHENALCEKHYTAEEDGLSQPWEGSVWCNPPYGRAIGEWMRKAAESNRGGSLYASFPRGRTRDGGTTGSSARPPRCASYAVASSSVTRRAARRSRRPSWSTTGGGLDIGRSGDVS